ncbi:MAG: T9SS type A sorting domain-containing protein, partial [Bacteroidales bacterium]|nr:T9SS type A sorting domain-containing protein [Bacteroidales bacterium]
YFFKIYPYNGSGTTINYKTDGTIEEATATTDASLYSNGDFGFTTASGTWGTTNTNWKQWDGSGWNTTPAGVPSTSDNVFILAGNTCSLDASGKNCKNLTVESTAKLFGDGTAYEYINVYGNITCDGTIGNGATLDGICFNIEGGTCTISGAGDFDASRIRKNTSTNATTGLTINMNINLRYGGTALYSAVSNSTFDVTLNNGSTLALPGDGATLGSIAINGTNGAAGDRGGSITVNGTLNVSDIFYLFSNASTLPASVTIGSSGIVNVNQVLCSASGNAGHTFTINSGGKLNFNGSTADVWGTYSTTNNTYTFNTGSIVEYSYAGAQTIKSPANYSNLIVSGAGTKTLGENTIVDNDLTIQSGSVLVIPIANSMTVSGILTNSAGNAGLVIKSDASGTGSLIHSTAGVNATMERFMNNADWGNWQDGWHFLSSPVLDQAISPAFTTDPAIGYDFFLWNEPSNEWINYKNQSGGGGSAPYFDVVNSSNNFAMGRGYMAAYDEADTKAFSGALNVADVSRTGLGISSGLNKSWHLLGNPFSSALTWDASGAWSLTNISGVAKIWNEVNQSYSDLTSSPSTVIPATNGFMVQVSSGTGSLTLPSAKRAHDAQAFYKSTVSDLMLTAKSHEAGNAQESRIIVNPEATTDFDLMLDGEFLSGYGPLFYSVAGDLKLSTNSLPQISAETEIPFNFIKNEGTQFSITASGFEGLSATPYLIDLKTGSSQNLIDQPVYNFTAAEGDVPNRFLLKFGAVGIGDNIATEQTSIYSHGQIVYISSTKSANALISIYNITGQQVYTNTMVIDGQKQITLNTPTGWYIVKVRTQQGVATQKVFIKSNQ